MIPPAFWRGIATQNSRSLLSVRPAALLRVISCLRVMWWSPCHQDDGPERRLRM